MDQLPLPAHSDPLRQGHVALIPMSTISSGDRAGHLAVPASLLGPGLDRSRSPMAPDLSPKCAAVWPGLLHVVAHSGAQPPSPERESPAQPGQTYTCTLTLARDWVASSANGQGCGVEASPGRSFLSPAPSALGLGVGWALHNVGEGRGCC